jgi:transposase InsO family protein
VSRQRKPSRHASVDEQIQVVLAVLKGELSLAEAARRHGVTSATVGNWRDRFVDAGKAGMDRSRSWSRLRRRVFRDPLRERNRIWQMDFSEFETTRGGIWRICSVIDYATRYCIAATVTATSRGQDALACLRRAVAEAERVLDIDDLRADCGMMDVVDADDFVIGQAPAPITVVTDNGPCFRGTVLADAFTGDHPLLRHVRTRVRSPQTKASSNDSSAP